MSDKIQFDHPILGACRVEEDAPAPPERVVRGCRVADTADEVLAVVEDFLEVLTRPEVLAAPPPRAYGGPWLLFVNPQMGLGPAGYGPTGRYEVRVTLSPAQAEIAGVLPALAPLATEEAPCP